MQYTVYHMKVSLSDNAELATKTPLETKNGNALKAWAIFDPDRSQKYE